MSGRARATPARADWIDSARRIAPLAWPVLVGQLAVLAFSTIDTLLVARSGAGDLAALAVGGAIFVTIFVGFMGVLLALSPIVGQLYGAGRLHEAGRQVHQALWVAAALSLLGSGLLAFPHPFLALAQVGPAVAEKIRGYLLALALSLPASLLFTVYRAFNTALGRPRAVSALQVAGLALKLPLTALLVFGAPAFGLPALGVLGCGVATAIALWSQVAMAVWLTRGDTCYAGFALGGRGLDRPDRDALRQLLRLGVPMGASMLVEVSGFTFMSFFIARLGTTPVAGHQIVMNLVSLIFMIPLALAMASSTLVAQSLGAGDGATARRIGRHGLAIGCGLAAAVGIVIFVARAPVLGLYTADAAVVAAAMPLLAWVAVFHVADAAQVIAAFVLRAYKIATVPMVIYVAALWGIGLGGGYLLAFDTTGSVPAAMRGVRGYWIAATVGLVLAGVALSLFMARVLGRPLRALQPAG